MSAAKSDAGKQDKYNQIHTGRSTIKYILGQVQSNTYRGRITQVWNSNTSANERCFTYMLGASIIKIKCIHCGSIHMKMDFFAGFMCCHFVSYQPEIIALQVAQKWFKRTGGWRTRTRICASALLIWPFQHHCNKILEKCMTSPIQCDC